MPKIPLSLSVVLIAALGACAHSRGPLEWRLQVRTAEEWADLSALTDRAAQVAGVPVRSDVNPIAPRWYALTLECADRSSCKRATMRLAAQPQLFVELRRDEQRPTPLRPSAPTVQ